MRIDLDEPLTYPQWQERWTTPLINFVEFASREPSRLHDFIAITHDETFEMPPLLRGRASKEALSRRETAFVQPRSELRATGPRHGYRRMLLSAAALGDELEDVLRRWFDLVATHGEMMGLLFGTLSSRMYVRSKLVVLASVAEAFHRSTTVRTPIRTDVHDKVTDVVLAALDDPTARGHYERVLRYANQLSQRERIQELIERAGTVVAPLSRRPGRLAQRITETRNALVHLPAEPREVLHGHELIEAVELLVLVLHANLLLEFELGDERTAALLERSYGQQLLWERLHRRHAAWPRRGSAAS